MVILKPVLKTTGKILAAKAIDYCVDRAIEWFVEDIRIGGAH